MEEKILVSIIIPVFNVRQYLREAVDSVINQTYKRLEIIIIDDGSTDGSEMICEEYAKQDHRIVLIHQKNHGLSYARNVGLNCARGDVIAFLDSDDSLHPDFVNMMINTMTLNNVDLVVCKYNVFDTMEFMCTNGIEQPLPAIEEGRYGQANIFQSLINGEINGSVWNKIYCRRLWENIRFADGHVYEDLNTFLQVLSLCNTIYVLDQALYMYRKRSGSITTIHSKQNIRDRIISRSKYYTFIEKHTPELFSVYDLQKCQRDQLKGMISDFVLYSKPYTMEQQQFIMEFKRQIIKRGEKVYIKDCATRIAYLLIKHCPRLLWMIYPIYKAFRNH